MSPLRTRISRQLPIRLVLVLPGEPLRLYLMILLLPDGQISRSKTLNLPRVNAGFIKHTFSQMEDFAVTCRLVLSVSHLISGSCSSPRAFGLGFLQTPPRDDALALLLAFGSASTWYRDFHPVSSVPCPAHTMTFSRRGTDLKLKTKSGYSRSAGKVCYPMFNLLAHPAFSWIAPSYCGHGCSEA